MSGLKISEAKPICDKYGIEINRYATVDRTLFELIVKLDEQIEDLKKKVEEKK